MNELVIADRYASALFEIARSSGEEAAIGAELSSFAAALKASPELEKFFQNPHFSLEDKEKTLKDLYQKHAGPAQHTLVRFFALLLKKHRFYLVYDVSSIYKKIVDESHEEAVVHIQSAVLLPSEAKRQIVSRMERIAGSAIDVRQEVVPSMIGGVIVRFRNKVLDGSVKNKIRFFQKELTKGELWR